MIARSCDEPSPVDEVFMHLPKVRFLILGASCIDHLVPFCLSADSLRIVDQRFPLTEDS